jgi:hypothetical protein
VLGGWHKDDFGRRVFCEKRKNLRFIVDQLYYMTPEFFSSQKTSQYVSALLTRKRVRKFSFDTDKDLKTKFSWTKTAKTVENYCLIT